MSTTGHYCDRCKQPAYTRYSSTGFAPWMCVECVSGQRSIITPIPIAMSPTVQALTAQRDALLEALRDLADTNNDFSEALVRARLAIAKATTDTTEKP